MTQNLSKTTKRLFKTAGIFSFIFFSLYLIFSVGVLFEIAIFEDLVKSLYTFVYPNITEAELETTMFTFIIDSGFACVINFFAGKSYINLSKSNKFYIEGERTIIFLIAVQFLFGLCVLPCILAIIANVLYKKGINNLKKINEKVFEEFNANQANETTNAIISDADSVNLQTEQNNTQQESTQNPNINITNAKLSITTMQIIELKNKLKENKITQEEYDEEFDKILSGKNI